MLDAERLEPHGAVKTKSPPVSSGGLESFWLLLFSAISRVPEQDFARRGN